MFCKLIRDLLILDVVEIHLIEEDGDGDPALYLLQISNGVLKYRMVLLNRPAGSVAIQSNIG